MELMLIRSIIYMYNIKNSAYIINMLGSLMHW